MLFQLHQNKCTKLLLEAGPWKKTQDLILYKKLTIAKRA
jgi:hypothetical protein